MSERGIPSTRTTVGVKTLVSAPILGEARCHGVSPDRDTCQVDKEAEPGASARISLKNMVFRVRALALAARTAGEQSGQFDTRAETLAPVCATRLTLTA